MEEMIKTRFRTAFGARGINVHKISNGDKVLENKIQRQLKDTAMTLDVFLTLLDAIPGINLEWLIYGKGSIEGGGRYKTDDDVKAIVSEPSDDTLKFLKEQLKTKDEQISHLLQVLTSFNK